MEGFSVLVIIFLVISVFGAIGSVIKKNPEVKKFFEDVKKEFSGTSTAEGSKPYNPYKPKAYSGLADEIKKKSNPVKKTVTVSGEGTAGVEGVGTEGIAPHRMHSQLTEMTSSIYEPIKSRNEQLKEDSDHRHPADGGITEITEPYSGSLGVTYAGEGCEEHGNLRYISDTPQQDERIRLTTLQKIIVFGEAINKRKSAR